MAPSWIPSFGRRRLLLVGIGGLVVVVGGAVALGVLGTPTVTGVDNGFGNVTENTTEIETDIHLHNPNPMGVTAGGLTVDYEVRLNDLPMANGTHEGVSIEGGNSTLSTTSEMNNTRIPAWWVSHLRAGERTTLTVHADVHSSLLGRTFDAPAVEREIETDLIEAFNSDEDRELNADSAVVPDPVLIVRETRGEWGTVTENETEIRMQFVVYNPRSFPVTISSIGYDIGMNGIDMGSGESEGPYVIPPGGEETIDATFRLDNQHLDEWWVSHLQNDQVTTLKADFYLRVDLAEGGGSTARIPLDTMERTIETDIFGEGSSGENGTDDGTNGTETPAGTATPGGETETSDGTDTPTETETPTPTETEDPIIGTEMETATETETETTTETETATETETPTGTETEDGGLLELEAVDARTRGGPGRF